MFAMEKEDLSEEEELRSWRELVLLWDDGLVLVFSSSRL